MEFLCLFFPSFLSILIYKKVKTTVRIENLIIKYGLFVLFSNIISFSILILYTGVDYELFLNTSPLVFVLKYLVVNTLINFFIAFLLIRVEEKIQWNIKMKANQNEKK